MTRRGRRGRGRRRLARVAFAAVLVSGLLVGLDAGAAFQTATVERQSGADVVSDADGVVSLDVDGEVRTGAVDRLVNTSNDIDRQLTVTVALTGDADDQGDLVVNGTNIGDSTTYTLADGESERVAFDAPCDSSLVDDAVTFEVSVEGTGVSGRAVRSVPIHEGACGTTTGVVYATTGDRGLRTVREGAKTVYDAAGVQVTAPQRRDFDGDGRTEIPYVDDGGADIRLLDRANETTVLFDASAWSVTPETAKTRMAVGTWNGSDQSAFFVGTGESTIYRTGGNGPVEIATASNGASAVLGVLDVDGDSEDEIVFLGGSAQLRYVESDGTTVKIPNGGAGTNNGVGAGSPADFDGDGTPRVPFVDGSSILSLVTADGQKTTLSDTDGNDIKVDKAPLAAFDWDGDGNPEILFRDGGVLHVADDIDGGSATVTEVTHNGTTIEVAAETGAA